MEIPSFQEYEDDNLISSETDFYESGEMIIDFHSNGKMSSVFYDEFLTMKEK